MSLLHETLDYDPLTKTTTIFHGSPDGEEFTIETLQDATDIVDVNQTLYNDFDERARWGEHMQRVASIPATMYFELMKQGIIEQGDPKSKKLLKWLQDNDYKKLRTRPGRLA